ncbi:hypothetical protein [Azospira sp.]|uniref:hypothetical protein n=1 Tax=Azospira sp. TaxID=1872671 RepID=UPI002569565D|nr:hypothetical protein [Azospira sp.]MDK9689706.1 hypothetical protein [Azospira sp.]
MVKRLFSSERHPAIKELPNEIVDEIYAKYISGVEIKSLIEDYGIAVSVSQFFRIFPPAYDGASICRHCGQQMYFSRPSKSSLGHRYNEKRYCSCGHYELRTGSTQRGILNCNCSECSKEALALKQEREKERLEADAKRRRELLDVYRFRKPVSFESLSLREVVCLLAFLSCRATEDLSMILPLSTVGAGSRFSATDSHSLDLLRLLYQKGMLEVDAQHSSLDAFVSEDIGRFYLSSVHWCPNISVGGDETARPLSALWPWLMDFFSHGGWKETWCAEILDLWIELGVEECVQYLEMRIQETRSLQFSAEEKTRTELRLLLQDNSVAQIYSFCFMAVKDASAFLDHVNCKGIKHASNTVPGSLKSIAARYTMKGKEPSSYHRDSRCPRSAMSQTLFDTILRLEDDAGFKFPPVAYWTEALEPRYSNGFGGVSADVVGGKHYLMCLECFSPDVCLRFNSQKQIEMVCPDCGSRTTFEKR